MPRTVLVGHSRGTRATRGEPRPSPVHITLIATCRVYNSAVVIRRVTPGRSPGYETPTDRLVNLKLNVLSSRSRGTWGGVCRALQPAEKHITCNCVSQARVLNQKPAMGYANGGRARGGSTSRKESNEGSKEKKESRPSGEKIPADSDEIRRLVAKFLKEQATNTNPKKAPRRVRTSPAQDLRGSRQLVRALGFNNE